MKPFRSMLIGSILFSAGILFAADDAFPAGSRPDSGNLRGYLELVRKNVRSDKALIVAQNIDFTEEEAVEFWPLYNEYELELSKWYDQRFALVKSYLQNEKTMTEDETRRLVNDAFSLEEKRTELKRKYFKKFSKAVGPRKSARYFQIENQLNAMIDLRIAAEMPLIK